MCTLTIGFQAVSVHPILYYCEQAVIIIRWVGKATKYTSSLASTATLNATQGVTYVLFRLNLPLKKFRRQCYDGGDNMSGQRKGVAKRIQELEPG